MGQTDLVGIVVGRRDLDGRRQVVHDPVVRVLSSKAPRVLHGRANLYDVLRFRLGEGFYPVDEPELCAVLLTMLVDERADEESMRCGELDDLFFALPEDNLSEARGCRVE